MNSLNTLPTGLEELSASRVLKRTMHENRVPHALLFHGPSSIQMEALAVELADSLLRTERWKEPQIQSHPDLFWIRPQNKMRQISTEQVRELIQNIQKSPHTAKRKVAIISDADRMHLSSSNIFLKTLEEPPDNTTLILITRRFYALLDTIRSRCISFKIQLQEETTAPEGWDEWIQDYSKWIQNLAEGSKAARFRTEPLFTLYDLIPRFEIILKNAISDITSSENRADSSTLTPEEEEAHTVGLQRALRLQLLETIEQATLEYVKASPGRTVILKGERVVEQLERTRFLLDVNLSEGVALEHFLLTSLRLWTSPL